MKRPAVLGGEAAFPDGLRFARPFLPPFARVAARVLPSYERGALTNGPLVRELEGAVARRLGVAHVVAVSSCTSGLMLTLRSLGVDRPPVVLPSFTFSASAHAIAWNGRPPVFAECDPQTFQLDLADAATRLDGAGVLLATHVFGAPCAAEELEALAGQADAALVFDAAHALGASRRGRAVGTFGDAEVFSLSPTKLVAAGEGGLVATDHEHLAEEIRLGRDYGNPGDYDTRFVGLNARMSELHAATALESLLLLDEHLERRRRLARTYAKLLGEVPGLVPQVVDDADDSTYKDFTLAVDEAAFGMGRDLLVRALGAENIDTRCYFDPPVHRQQAYAPLSPPALPVTEAVSASVVSLPMFGDLSPDAVEAVVEALARLHDHAEEVRAGTDT